MMEPYSYLSRDSASPRGVSQIVQRTGFLKKKVGILFSLPIDSIQTE